MEKGRVVMMTIEGGILPLSEGEEVKNGWVGTGKKKESSDEKCPRHIALAGAAAAAAASGGGGRNPFIRAAFPQVYKSRTRVLPPNN